MARPTGNLTQSWGADEVSLLSSHIITTPTRIAAVSNFNGGPERYAMLVNSDGTMAPMQIVTAQKIRNVTPWDTRANIAPCPACAPGLRHDEPCHQRIDPLFPRGVRSGRDARPGGNLDDLTDVTATFGTTTVNVVVGNFSLGTYPLTIGSPPDGPYTVGLFYDTRTEILPPAIDDNEGSDCRAVDADHRLLRVGEGLGPVCAERLRAFGLSGDGRPVGCAAVAHRAAALPVSGLVAGADDPDHAARSAPAYGARHEIRGGITDVRP
jgi:hypothetical protein